MELKRYVLTSDKKIYDLATSHILINGFKRPNGYSGEEAKIGDYLNENIITDCGYITKTSDNILDLVEVGDLVGFEIKIGEDIMKHIHLIDRIKIDRIEYQGGACSPKEVTHIYKLQPNGDYKRYEV